MVYFVFYLLHKKKVPERTFSPQYLKKKLDKERKVLEEFFWQILHIQIKIKHQTSIEPKMVHFTDQHSQRPHVNFSRGSVYEQEVSQNKVTLLYRGNYYVR